MGKGYVKGEEGRKEGERAREKVEEGGRRERGHANRWRRGERPQKRWRCEKEGSPKRWKEDM